MNKKYILTFVVLLFLTACQTTDIRQRGGSIGFVTEHSDVQIDQPENAEEPASVDFEEDGVVIRYDKGDIFEMEMETSSNGDIKKSINFQPQSPNELEITNTSVEANTGSSYEDMVGQLKVFLQHAKIILWVGIGFIAAGGIFAGFFRDIRSGIILAGIGVVMLGGYALLPQIYSNWLMVLGIGVVVIPLYWWLTHKQNKRISHASVMAYEKVKLKYPEIAKEMSLDFKAVLPRNDVEKAKKIKNPTINTM